MSAELRKHTLPSLSSTHHHHHHHHHSHPPLQGSEWARGGFKRTLCQHGSIAVPDLNHLHLVVTVSLQITPPLPLSVPERHRLPARLVCLAPEVEGVGVCGRVWARGCRGALSTAASRSGVLGGGSYAVKIVRFLFRLAWGRKRGEWVCVLYHLYRVTEDG